MASIGAKKPNNWKADEFGRDTGLTPAQVKDVTKRLEPIFQRYLKDFDGKPLNTSTNKIKIEEALAYALENIKNLERIGADRTEIVKSWLRKYATKCKKNGLFDSQTQDLSLSPTGSSTAIGAPTSPSNASQTGHPSADIGNRPSLTPDSQNENGGLQLSAGNASPPVVNSPAQSRLEDNYSQEQQPSVNNSSASEVMPPRDSDLTVPSPPNQNVEQGDPDRANYSSSMTNVLMQEKEVQLQQYASSLKRSHDDSTPDEFRAKMLRMHRGKARTRASMGVSALIIPKESKMGDANTIQEKTEPGATGRSFGNTSGSPLAEGKLEGKQEGGREDFEERRLKLRRSRARRNIT